MTTEPKLDDALHALPRESAPPMSDALRELVTAAEPVHMRRPLRQWGVITATGLLTAAAMLAILGQRPDLSGLSVVYLAVLGVAWLVACIALAALALLPPRGSALLSWRRAGFAATAAILVFAVVGLLWTEAVPGVSIRYPLSVANIARWAPICLSIGAGAAILPIILACAWLRRAIPFGAGWIGAAIGASGGCVGGLILHFHCNIAEPSHFGLVHAGGVLLASGLGALIVPRFARS